jgi:DNA-binding IclR family transcriptional regulator
MSVTRLAVLERLAATSDAARRETTTLSTLAAALDANERAVERQLDALTACEFARVTDDDRVRVTVTGEEFLALDPDETVVVDPPRDRSED